MKTTQQNAEQAATKASREILRRMTKLQKSVLEFDEIHVSEAEQILHERVPITNIIRKHIFDCYVASWITEAEELEDLFGDELLASFLMRIQWMRDFGPDMRLKREAAEYISEIPKTDRRLHAIKLKDGTIPPRRPMDPVDFYVYRHFQKYIRQLDDITRADIPKTEKTTLTAWRTGEHGESGLGYQLTSLLRTESDTAQAEASFDVYEEAGVDAYKFNAMLDDKTCDKCKALDGRVFLLSEKEPGVNFPRIHPRCRCYIDPVRGGSHGR